MNILPSYSEIRYCTFVFLWSSVYGSSCDEIVLSSVSRPDVNVSALPQPHGVHSLYNLSITLGIHKSKQTKRTYVFCHVFQIELLQTAACFWSQATLKLISTDILAIQVLCCTNVLPNYFSTFETGSEVHLSLHHISSLQSPLTLCKSVWRQSTGISQSWFMASLLWTLLG
jgi:hypothetical protein